MQIEPRTNDDPELRALVAAQQRELAEAEASAGGIDGGYALHDDVRFLALRDGGAVVAIGAIQAVDGETAEIKRMYVVPPARGKGYGRAMLAGPGAGRGRPRAHPHPAGDRQLPSGSPGPVPVGRLPRDPRLRRIRRKPGQPVFREGPDRCNDGNP